MKHVAFLFELSCVGTKVQSTFYRGFYIQSYYINTSLLFYHVHGYVNIMIYK